MEERRRQTNGNVGWSHLVLVHAGHHVLQEEEQRSQRLPVLVRKQQDGRLSCNQLLILGKICMQKAGRQLIFFELGHHNKAKPVFTVMDDLSPKI